MNEDAIKQEPMVVDSQTDEMSQPQGQQDAQQSQQQQHILNSPQQMIPQMSQQEVQHMPPQQTLQQQQAQNDSGSPGQQPLDENDRGSDPSVQNSSNASHELHTDSQKLPAFSGANNASQTMTKGNILEAIKDFDSSIPDAVVHHFLNVAGMQTSDQRIVRLIAIAAQKLIHDIVSDSLQHCKLRGAQNKKTKEKKYTLTMEDLGSALTEYGIEVNRPLYFN